MFKQDFSDFYKVYSAVHDNKLREEVNSQRDEISEMDLSLFSDKDLIEIAEEVVQELFEKGYKIEDVSVVLSDDTSSSFRKEKLRRINEALDSVVEEVTNNAATTAIESFKLYRAHKKLQERRIEQRGIEEGRIKSAQALNIYTVEKATIKKGLKSILESIKEAATPESGTGKYYREGKPTQQQLANRAKREKIKQLTNQGKHKEASALHNEHNEEEVVDEGIEDILAQLEKKRIRQGGNPDDSPLGKKTGRAMKAQQDKVRKKAGVKTEEVVKEKESYDTVAAVIDYDRSKKGSKDATYDSDHGKKKAAKKERDYAAWEREKMKRDDPNWKHKKYHTGMHGEQAEPIETEGAKGQAKKELKDVKKAAETLKGKNIAKADKVEEGQSWITSGKFSQEEIDSILEKEEIRLGKSQELSEDWLDASIEVAAEYFFSEGINEDGLEQIIEEVGLENFVEFVTDPIDELSEERSARKASVRAPSYEKVKAKVDATDAAKKKAKKGEYAPSYAKKETDVTVYDDKPTAKKKAAPAKKPVAKKAPVKKKVVVKKVAPAKKVDNQKKVVKSVATTKTKQQPKPASKKGLVGKIRSAVEKGVERHKAARAKGREPEKRAKEFAKGVASGVKTAVKFAKDVKKVVEHHQKDANGNEIPHDNEVNEAKKSKENPKGRHPRDQAELDRAQEYIKKNPNFGKVSEAKVDAGKSPETKEKERNVRKFGVSHNVSGHGKLRRSLHKMNRGDKKIKGDKSAWVEMESAIPVVVEKDLNAAERRALPNKDFVFPGKGEGPEGKQRGAYPINDKKHARNALAMAAAHASPEKQAKVKAAVKKKFPDIEVKEQEEVVSELNRYGKETGKATGSMNKKSGTPVKKGGSTDKALNIVRGMIRKQQGRPEGQQKKTKGVKSDAGTGKYLSKQQDKKDYAAKAKKAGFKDTQSYTDTVARYGGESNYKAGRGLGT